MSRPSPLDGKTPVHGEARQEVTTPVPPPARGEGTPAYESGTTAAATCGSRLSAWSAQICAPIEPAEQPDTTSDASGEASVPAAACCPYTQSSTLLAFS